jgi:hypothetical protein
LEYNLKARGLALFTAVWTSVNPVFSASNSPAVLNQASGKVLVSHGNGFVHPNAGEPVQAGDKVMVGADAAVTLSFGNCHIAIAGGQVFTVPASAPCDGQQTVAAIDGMVVTPVSAPATTSDLNRIIARHSREQVSATESGQVEVASCIGSKIDKLKSLKNFWSRNPGIDPTEMIEDLDARASNCGTSQTPVRQTAKTSIRSDEIVLADQAAPLREPMAAGGMSGSTIALVGAGVLAIGGAGALLLLSNNKKDDQPVSVK